MSSRQSPAKKESKRIKGPKASGKLDDFAGATASVSSDSDSVSNSSKSSRRVSDSDHSDSEHQDINRDKSTRRRASKRGEKLDVKKLSQNDRNLKVNIKKNDAKSSR